MFMTPFCARGTTWVVGIPSKCWKWITCRMVSNVVIFSILCKPPINFTADTSKTKVRVSRLTGNYSFIPIKLFSINIIYPSTKCLCCQGDQENGRWLADYKCTCAVRSWPQSNPVALVNHYIFSHWYFKCRSLFPS